MKQFIAKAQALGQKASELRQVVQGLPAHAARIREAVTMTGSELQQLRVDVQSNIQGLRADNEDRLLRAMREINDHSAVFAEAGYDLNGMDLDLGLNHRLAVHLDKFEDIPHSALRSLLGRQSSETVRSVVAGIIKGEETAANVQLSHLRIRGLILHVGPLPMVRICWRDSEISPTEGHSEPAAPVPERTGFVPTASPQTSPPPIPAAPPSMFELRPMPTGTVRIESKPAPENPVSSVAQAPEPQPPVSSWSHSALDRFKKMPGVSKYGP